VHPVHPGCLPGCIEEVPASCPTAAEPVRRPAFEFDSADGPPNNRDRPCEPPAQSDHLVFDDFSAVPKEQSEHVYNCSFPPPDPAEGPAEVWPHIDPESAADRLGQPQKHTASSYRWRGYINQPVLNLSSKHRQILPPAAGHPESDQTHWPNPAADSELPPLRPLPSAEFPASRTGERPIHFDPARNSSPPGYSASVSVYPAAFHTSGESANSCPKPAICPVRPAQVQKPAAARPASKELFYQKWKAIEYNTPGCSSIVSDTKGGGNILSKSKPERSDENG